MSDVMEKVFVGIVAADVALFLFLCACFLRVSCRAPRPSEAVLAAVVAEACPTLEESRPSSTS